MAPPARKIGKDTTRCRTRLPRPLRFGPRLGDLCWGEKRGLSGLDDWRIDGAHRLLKFASAPLFDLTLRGLAMRASHHRIVIEILNTRKLRLLSRASCFLKRVNARGEFLFGTVHATTPAAHLSQRSSDGVGKHLGR